MNLVFEIVPSRGGRKPPETTQGIPGRLSANAARVPWNPVPAPPAAQYPWAS